MTFNPDVRPRAFTPPSDTILHGDCIHLMRRAPYRSVDFILTDPPYVTHYRTRDGRTVANDDNDDWLKPAFAQMHRLLKDGGFCVSFYGWSKADRFIAAWREAGFRIVGHIVFRKTYASSSRYLRYEHEQAYLLAKGSAEPPTAPIPDVIDFAYTGNGLHPTQKPVSALIPLIQAFSKPGDLVLDPFCGSGSTLIAANSLGRRFVGMELDSSQCETARNRLRQVRDRAAAHV